MTKDTFPMTQTGFEQLQQELKEYETVKRDHAKQRIYQARKFCDFHEDSEYEMALQELETIQERIATIQYMIQQAEIVQKTEKSNVEFGHTVSFNEMESDETEIYTIVGTEETDPFQGKISYQSPVAQSILGAKIGDEVIIKTPNGKRQVKIVNIS